MKWRSPFYRDFCIGWLAGAVVGALLLLAAMAVRADVIGHWFSPKGGAEKALIKYTDNAKKEIFWQSYNFTSQPLADALKRANARGVRVVVICDYDESRKKWSKAAELAKAGVTVYLDNKHAIAHDKTRIFDSRYVLMGSYNDSDSAENRNGESLIAFDDQDDVQACVENFKAHMLHSIYLETQEPEKP
jgi:phosphatidylserine/phosphatidylglycerophosphate/cardiolipin synthase-like enzyme